jgi:hypothetical protein
MSRFDRIKELMAQKTAVDSELKKLNEEIKLEYAALKQPRKARAKKEAVT